MWPELIVFPPPLLDLPCCIGQADEPVVIETLVSEAPIEALDERILVRFARINEMQGHSVLVGPLIHGQAGELRPVVHDDLLGQSTRPGQVVQDARHTLTADRRRHFNVRTLPREIIDQRQATQPSASSQSVMNKIHGPALVRLIRYFDLPNPL